MKYLKIKLALAILAVVTFFALLGIVGDYDYTSQVLYSMSYEDYNEVRSILTEKNGQAPTEREIAHYWVENHQ